jgi:hypothetical protein
MLSIVVVPTSSSLISSLPMSWSIAVDLDDERIGARRRRAGGGPAQLEL